MPRKKYPWPRSVVQKMPEYIAWDNMRRRCRDPKYHAAHRYSGRGITVDPRWDDFLVFLRDMGYRPSPHLTLERLDNDLGYSKDNCVWDTKSAQARNRVTSKLDLSDVLMIRGLYSAGNSSYGKLAKQYGVAKSLVARIIKGEKWRGPVVNNST